MFYLFKENARSKCYEEDYSYYPYKRDTYSFLSFHCCCDVYSKEEDRNSAPEYLQMTDGFVNRDNVFYDYTPHDHQYGEPPIGWMFDDEVHIKRTDNIKEHDGWDVPEGQLVV